jgi:hypothetical protein
MGAGASSARIQKLQKQIAEEALLRKVTSDLLCIVAFDVCFDNNCFSGRR